MNRPPTDPLHRWARRLIRGGALDDTEGGTVRSATRGGDRAETCYDIIIQYV